MNDQTKTLKTACRCAQFCMLRMSVCVVSFLLLSTMVSMMLKVYLSLYTLLRSHLFVNCCIRRYSLYISMDTGSVDLCESHEGRQSLCQSLRRCLLLTCQKSFLLIRGGRVWAVLINSPAGPSGKSVSFSQKEKA